MLHYFAKCAKRVIVTETEESDVPDKRKRDGIDGEASVNVAAVDNKPLSALTDAVSAPCNRGRFRQVGRPGIPWSYSWDRSQMGILSAHA